MPTPDRDSASLRVVNLLGILRQMTDKLVFAAVDSPGWRSKHEAWLPASNTGIKILEGYDIIEKHLRQYGRVYDVVILSRLIVAHRYFDTVREFATKAALLFDTTDLHYLRGYRGAKVTGNIKLLRMALLAKKDELAIVRKADCTLVVSSAEKKILEQECPGACVNILSNIHEVYGSRNPFSDRDGILFVGSFSHHPNDDAIRYFYKEIYPFLNEKLEGVKITIIGSDPPQWLKEAATDNFIITGYVPDIEHYFNSIRLSIAPLRYGAGVKGKVLLSMGYGVPVVATSIAAEGIPVKSGRDMFLADTTSEFCDAIADLYHNEALWNQLSGNGLKIVERYFSFMSARKALLNTFESLGINVPD